MSGSSAPPFFPPQQPTPMMMYMMPVLMPPPPVTQPPVPPSAPPPSPPLSPAVPGVMGSAALSPRALRLNADIADLLAFDSSETDSLTESVDSDYTIPDVCDLNRCTTIKTAGCNDVCGICRDNIVPTSIVRSIPCQHLFHITCLDRALEDRSTCPICRTEIIVPGV